MTPPNTVPPWVSERQRFLLEKLNGKNTNLRLQYLGALMVLRDEANPDRLALAGHGLRELSEQIMRNAGIETTKYNLGSEVQNLREPWERVREEATACSGVCGSCAGDSLRRFLKLLTDFFIRHALNRPRARARAASAIEQIDVNQRIAGSEEHEPAAKKWAEIHEFFTKCGHHGPTDLDDVHSKLFVFEDLLIRLLLPSPSSDMSAIDEILARENWNA